MESGTVTNERLFKLCCSKSEWFFHSNDMQILIMPLVVADIEKMASTDLIVAFPRWCEWTDVKRLPEEGSDALRGKSWS